MSSIRPLAGIVTLSGVQVVFDREQLADLGEAARSLSDGLNEQGIRSEIEASAKFKSNNRSAIHVLVGKKP